MRILFFGDGLWAANSLQRLVKNGLSILGVVIRTNPTDHKLITIAKGFQLPIFQPQKVNEPKFVAKVAALKPEINISVSYDQILRSSILGTTRLGFINFHAGKLPYYRGRNVINWAIINNETEIGLTAHYVDEGIDTGDIILQQTVPISWSDTYGDVLRNVTARFPDLVAETIHLIANNQVQRISQASLPGTYFAMREDGDEWLDWSDSSRNLYNKIRAISHPGPGARTFLGDQEIIIWRAFYDPTWPDYMATAGQVVGRNPDEGVVIKTGDSTLLVKEIQIGDKVEIPRWKIGVRLGLNLQEKVTDLEKRVALLENQIQSN